MKLSIPYLAASLIVFGGLSEVWAFDQEQYEAVKSGEKECASCDLSNAPLNDIDLTNVNFSGANLEGAEFYRSNLSGANLKGANFTGARLDQVDLTNVNLVDVNISKAWCDFSTKLAADSGWTCEGVILTRKANNKNW